MYNTFQLKRIYCHRINVEKHSAHFLQQRIKLYLSLLLTSTNKSLNLYKTVDGKHGSCCFVERFESKLQLV